MAYTDIDNGYMTCDQVNQNVAQTVRMTVRAPRIANRLFETLEQAQAFVDHVGDTATATRGLILSVFDDTEEKNGLYQVEAVAINPGEVGRLKKIGGDTGLQILHVVDIDTDLAGYKEESIYMCIVDRSADNLSSLIFVFEVNDQQTQILWGYNGYYMRSYNTVNDEWGPWKWYGYVDGYHTHKSEDITDSVSSLPVRVEDREKLVQAGAVEKYIKDLGQGNAVPTVDHKLIYSEDNKSLIAKEFMLPYVYVVDNAADVDKCKSPVPAITDTTDVLSTWRAYSNSQNMPEYGGGISFEPDTYTPVGYSQGYKAWSQNKQLGYIRSDNVASEHNGYINIDASDNIRFEAVLGIEDNAPSNRTPNTVTTKNTSSMGIWLIAGEGVEARYVEKNGKKYYRDSTKDTAEGSRETGTNWRAWVCEDDQEDILYGDYVNIHTVSGGTETFIASGDAYTKDAAPDGTTLHEASGALSMLCINFDNHDFNTISIGACSYDVSGQTIVGGAYCPISRDRGRVTYIGNEEENLVDSADIITSNEALNMVPYDFSGDSAGMSSFVKALIEYSGSTLTIKFTDIAVCNTGDKDVTLANAKNWAYNGSSVTIDFVSKTYTYTDKFGNTSNEEELPDGFNWDTFSEGKLRIMYQAIGLRGSLFMSTKSPQLMNIILNTEDNTVTRFNEETWQYETYGGDIKDLIDIMHGSHMAYNDITEDLWYSDGYKIFKISKKCVPPIINHTFKTTYTVGGMDKGTQINEQDLLSEILYTILCRSFEARTNTAPSVAITSSNPGFTNVEAYSTITPTLGYSFTDGTLITWTGITNTDSGVTTAQCSVLTGNTAYYMASDDEITNTPTIVMDGPGSQKGCKVHVEYSKSVRKVYDSDKWEDRIPNEDVYWPASGITSSAKYYTARYKYFAGYAKESDIPTTSAAIRALSLGSGQWTSSDFITSNSANISGSGKIFTPNQQYLVVAVPYNVSTNYKYVITCSNDMGQKKDVSYTDTLVEVNLGGGTSTNTEKYRVYTINLGDAKYMNVILTKES